VVAWPTRNEWCGDPFGGQAICSGAFAEPDGNRLPDRHARHRPTAQAGEQSAGLGAAVSEPGVEGCDRVGGGVLAVDDGDDLALGLLIGFGPADGEQDSPELEVDVVQRHCCQLGSAQC